MIEDARKIVDAAISSVKPEKLVNNGIEFDGNIFRAGDFECELSSYKNIYVLGAGKASGLMAESIEKLLEKRQRLKGGVVIVKYGHAAPSVWIRILEAGHPITDENGLLASEKLIELARRAGKDDLVIFLLSGGGSALLESLPEEISLDDLQVTGSVLLACGADIEEINCVRKHISGVKGGRLAGIIHPASTLTLIISDVIGDPLSSIASGPTVPDEETFFDVLRIIEKYKIESKLPSLVMKYIKSGQRGERPETLKSDNPVFERVKNIIVGNNAIAVKAAERAAIASGFDTEIISSSISGDAEDIGRMFASKIKEIYSSKRKSSRPICIIAGGETTVTIRGGGKGGRNQHLVLSALNELMDFDGNFIFMSVGTDGTDGPTDAAGAFISPEIISEVKRRELDFRRSFEQNDSYTFFSKVNALIKTGPTGTNVMDIMIAIL